MHTIGELALGTIGTVEGTVEGDCSRADFVEILGRTVGDGTAHVELWTEDEDGNAYDTGVSFGTVAGTTTFGTAVGPEMGVPLGQTVQVRYKINGTVPTQLGFSVIVKP